MNIKERQAQKVKELKDEEIRVLAEQQKIEIDSAAQKYKLKIGNEMQDIDRELQVLQYQVDALNKKKADLWANYEHLKATGKLCPTIEEIEAGLKEQREKERQRDLTNGISENILKANQIRIDKAIESLEIVKKNYSRFPTEPMKAELEKAVNFLERAVFMDKNYKERFKENEY